jgi:hypothetical protein
MEGKVQHETSSGKNALVASERARNRFDDIRSMGDKSGSRIDTGSGGCLDYKVAMVAAGSWWATGRTIVHH